MARIPYKLLLVKLVVFCIQVNDIFKLDPLACELQDKMKRLLMGSYTGLKQTNKQKFLVIL